MYWHGQCYILALFRYVIPAKLSLHPHPKTHTHRGRSYEARVTPYPRAKLEIRKRTLLHVSWSQGIFTTVFTLQFQGQNNICKVWTPLYIFGNNALVFESSTLPSNDLPSLHTHGPWCVPAARVGIGGTAALTSRMSRPLTMILSVSSTSSASPFVGKCLNVTLTLSLSTKKKPSFVKTFCAYWETR